MPTEGTDRQGFRYPTEKWRKFKAVADPNASTALQQFIDWMIHEQKAPPPKRLPREEAERRITEAQQREREAQIEEQTDSQ